MTDPLPPSTSVPSVQDRARALRRDRRLLLVTTILFSLTTIVFMLGWVVIAGS